MVQLSYSDRSISFFSSRRRHTRLQGDWSSDVCSSDLDERDERVVPQQVELVVEGLGGLDGGGHEQVVDGLERGDALPGEHEQAEEQRGEEPAGHVRSASSVSRFRSTKAGSVVERGRGSCTSSCATTRPGRGERTATRSARKMASSTSWVTRRTVRGS